MCHGGHKHAYHANVPRSFHVIESNSHLAKGPINCRAVPNALLLGYCINIGLDTVVYLAGIRLLHYIHHGKNVDEYTKFAPLIKKKRSQFINNCHYHLIAGYIADTIGYFVFEFHKSPWFPADIRFMYNLINFGVYFGLIAILQGLLFNFTSRILGRGELSNGRKYTSILVETVYGCATNPVFFSRLFARIMGYPYF